MALPNEQLTREEIFLKAAATGNTQGLPTPLTRVEEYLKYIAENGSGGGGTSDYEQLQNLPQVNGTTLVGDKSLSDLGITQAIKKVASMIAGEFDANVAYETDAVVIYNDKLYIFTTDHAAGAWNAGEVEETTVAELIGTGGATPAPQTVATAELTDSITQLQLGQLIYSAFKSNEHLAKLIILNNTDGAIELKESVLYPEEAPVVFTIPWTAVVEITRTVFPTETDDAMVFAAECYGSSNDTDASRAYARFGVILLNGVVNNLNVDNTAAVKFGDMAEITTADVEKLQQLKVPTISGETLSI